MTFCEQMVPALSALLEKGETLKAPVYGTLLQKRNYTFGYLGFTEHALLVSLLQGDSQKLKGTSRIGTLLQKRNYTFGYLGFTEHALLVSLLQGDSQKLKGTSRIPFSSIQRTIVRKSLFPLQYILRIYLIDGDMIKFRISKKVYGFATQEENLDIFLRKMKTYT